jgi:hypothetical protein
VGKERIGVVEEGLHGSIFEVIRISIVHEYAGVRHGREQNAGSASQLTSSPPFLMNTRVLGDSVARPWMTRAAGRQTRILVDVARPLNAAVSSFALSGNFEAGRSVLDYTST